MVKLGILGSGIITECHFFGIDRIEEVQVAAIASIDEAQAKEACEKYGATYYYDYKDLLANEKDLDGIVVALPNHMHYEGCVAAIEAGAKHILCEKPLCTNPEDSKKLVELVKEKDVMFQTAYMKRFNPGFRKIKEYMEEMGEIEFVTSSIYTASPEPEVSAKQPNGSWHGDAKLSGGGFLTHSGSHHLDLLRYCFGEIKSVACKLRYDFDNFRDYYVKATLETADGVDIDMKLGRVDVQNLGPKWEPFRGGWNESIEVIATRGYLRVDNPSWQGYEAMQVTRWFKGMPGPQTEYFECNEQWINELQSFANSCKVGVLEAGSSDVIDGHKIDFIIDQMRESSNQGGKAIELEYLF
ncbi:MAG: Gfo/Idh/MocA family oxidoreductase [Eubacteriales bacterium]